MGTTVSVGGVSYEIPNYNESGWAQGQGNMSQFLVAVANNIPANAYINESAVTTSPTTVVSGKCYLVDTTAARTLNLPFPLANAFLHVKDATGTAATYNITLHRYGSEKIDGTAADKVLATNKGSWTLFSDGTDWFTLGDSTDRKISGNLYFTTSGKGIVGTTTTDSADTGNVGEFVSSTVASGSAVNVPSDTYTDITSITLTAGDWDVSGIVQMTGTPGGTTYSGGYFGTSAGSGGSKFDNTYINLGASSGLDLSIPMIQYRFSISGSTTIYLKATSHFTSSSVSAYGRIQARRIR